jgi:hypothetical protein
MKLQDFTVPKDHKGHKGKEPGGRIQDSGGLGAGWNSEEPHFQESNGEALAFSGDYGLIDRRDAHLLHHA